MTITKKLENLLDKESKNQKKRTKNNLQNVYDTLLKHGLPVKSEYTFPLKDTIGKAYFDKVQFKNFQ